MKTYDLQKKWDLTSTEVEALRHAYGHEFGVQLGTNYKRDDGQLLWEPTSDWEFTHNIVTNEGLDHALESVLDAATQITTWYVTASSSNTSAAAGMTYASPTYTEITSAQVDESTRQAWTGGTVSSQSIDNSASAARYTASGSLTLYGASLVGGGSAPSTLENTAGGGTLFAYSLFASSKAMSASDTIDITYTFTASDN